MSVVTTTVKGQVVIPARIRRKFGIVKGTPVHIYEEEDRIIVEPVLNHIHQLMMAVEYFVHQTACHDIPEEALVYSEHIERMHSNKWVASLSTLHRMCFEAGFEIETSVSGPVLPIPSNQLASRYAISNAETENTCQILKRECPDTDLIKEEENGSIVFGPYGILRCKAI